MTEQLRSRCRKCQSALLVPAEPRRAFCARGCYEQFYRTRCRVCAEPSIKGRLHVKKCSYAHRQNPTLYAYQKLQKPSDGGLSLKRRSDERNPYKTGIKTRTRSWGPTLSDDVFWLASLPMHPTDLATVRKYNNPDRIWRETAWSKPKVFFRPGSVPLNIIGGYQFAGAPDFEDPA